MTRRLSDVDVDRAIDEAARNWTSEDAPPDLAARVVARLRDAPSPAVANEPWRRSTLDWFVRHRLPALAAAGAAAVVILAVAALRVGPESAPPQSRASTRPATEAPAQAGETARAEAAPSTTPAVDPSPAAPPTASVGRAPARGVARRAASPSSSFDATAWVDQAIEPLASPDAAVSIAAANVSEPAVNDSAAKGLMVYVGSDAPTDAPTDAPAAPPDARAGTSPARPDVRVLSLPEIRALSIDAIVILPLRVAPIEIDRRPEIRR